MIKKLQGRFIRIAIFSLTVAMVLVVLVVNLANLFSVRAEMKATLSYIIENNEGGYPDGEEKQPPEPRTPRARRMASESRWFFAAYKDGKRIEMHAAGGNESEPEETDFDALVEAAAARGESSGRVGEYLYDSVLHEDGVRMLYFLNCENKLDSLRTLVLISAAACLGGILLALLIVTLASRRMIRPLLQNIEQQKQFITNASHELKTPLTVIAANMDVLRMDCPNNPWVISTRKQAAGMSRLVENLVYLSRMEEEYAPLDMKPLCLSALVTEAAEPFQAMAEYTGRTMTVRAGEDLMITGDASSMERLVTCLCDNALKYASEGGQILLEAGTEGHQAVLRVSNSVEVPLTKEQCERMFDRFYRADASRSKEKQSGHGIGLAIARAIVEKHGGTIRAEMAEGDRMRIICAFPRLTKA